MQIQIVGVAGLPGMRLSENQGFFQVLAGGKMPDI
jgi:hypothetical protein